MSHNATHTFHEYDVIVIGGGASGMMAAGRAAELGKKVLLLEKNKSLGEKLKITGGGRCNITNNERDVRRLLKFYGKAEQFLYSPFSQFGVGETFSFFESRGLPLIIEANNRVFPKSQRALDVFNILESYLKKHNVDIKTNTTVTKILVEKIPANKSSHAGNSNSSSITGTVNTISGVQVGKNIYKGKSIILATGGLSHPETGSTGDGFGWLRDLGHTLHDPTPTIVPLAVRESWVKELAGIAAPDVKITFYATPLGGGPAVKHFSKTGRILFTHFGLSGPLILNSAGSVSDLLYTGTVTATVDLHPSKDLGTLENHLIKIFDEHKNKMLKNIFSEITPAGTGSVIFNLFMESIKGTADAIITSPAPAAPIQVTTPDASTTNTTSTSAPTTPTEYETIKVHSVTKATRKRLGAFLKALPMTITGLMGFDRAVVADGGVHLTEVDMKTMRSHVIENLFITGDLLDIERPSGGYSLQLCWTSGYIAGNNS